MGHNAKIDGVQGAQCLGLGNITEEAGKDQEPEDLEVYSLLEMTA